MKLWRDPNSSELVLFNTILREVLSAQNLQMPRQCKICEAKSRELYIYFHIHANGRGGVWMWCAGGGPYFHGSLRPPQWWCNLDEIQEEQLASEPIYLDQFTDPIRAHWTSLLSNRNA